MPMTEKKPQSTETKPNPNRDVEAKEAAEHFGCSLETVIRSWVRKGGCPHDEAGGDYYFDLEETMDWLVATGKRLPGNPKGVGRTQGRPLSVGVGLKNADVSKVPAGEITITLAREKLGKERAQRMLKELELARQQGELIPREEHEQTMVGAIDATRTILLGLPRKLCDELSHCTSTEVKAKLGEALKEVCDLFAGRLNAADS